MPKSMRAVMIASLTATVAILAPAGAAWAYWSAQGSANLTVRASPAAPATQLKCTQLGNNDVRISWTQSGNSHTGFRLTTIGGDGVVDETIHLSSDARDTRKSYSGSALISLGGGETMTYKLETKYGVWDSTPVEVKAKGGVTGLGPLARRSLTCQAASDVPSDGGGAAPSGDAPDADPQGSENDTPGDAGSGDAGSGDAGSGDAGSGDAGSGERTPSPTPSAAPATAPSASVTTPQSAGAARAPRASATPTPTPTPGR